MFDTNSLVLVSTQTLSEISLFLPRLLAALLVLLLGAAISRVCKKVVVKLLETVSLSKAVQNTPVEHFLQNAELGQKIEVVTGNIVYWLLMLVVIHTSVSILGLAPLAAVLDKVLAYVPQVISAVLVLFFGILLAGVVESLIKGAIKSIDGHSSRLLGKISSYLVVTIACLVAVSELGIAREFIMILFVGLILTISLGLGLSVGLGGQDLVRKILTKWYERTSAEISEKNAE
jgi:hypothetical protein